MQYVFCCELFNVPFSKHIWGQPSDWKIAAKMVQEPWEQCSMSAIMGRHPEEWKSCYQLGVLVLSCVRQWWKALEDRGTLWKGVLWRGDAHLLLDCFRHTASVCKSVFCNAIVSVAFCPEVQLLRISTDSLVFFFFTMIFFQSFLFLLQSRTRHSSVNGICLWPQSIRPLSS